MTNQPEQPEPKPCPFCGHSKAIEALESIIKQQPCIEGGGCFFPMHDGEGNYIGEQNVDPISVIQGMVQTAIDALSEPPLP